MPGSTRVAAVVALVLAAAGCGGGGGGDDVDARIDGLDRRIAELEADIDRLEGGDEGTGETGADGEAGSTTTTAGG